MAISGAYRATPIRSLAVKVGVLLLGIHLDSIQAQLRIRLEESEAVQAIRDKVEKMGRWIGVTQGEGKGKRGRRARGMTL
jgi:hypothetical protein